MKPAIQFLTLHDSDEQTVIRAKIIDASDSMASDYVAWRALSLMKQPSPPQKILIERIEVPDDIILYQPSADSGAMGGA